MNAKRRGKPWSVIRIVSSALFSASATVTPLEAKAKVTFLYSLIL